jgi:hypothetical protein
VRDGCAIRTFSTGSLNVDVDPLVVAGGDSERVNTFLIDGNPLGDTEFLADGLNGLIDGRNDSHGSSLRLRSDPGMRISTAADTTRIRPATTRAVVSATKPATAVDNPT